jgi:hypothetical protein
MRKTISVIIAAGLASSAHAAPGSLNVVATEPNDVGVMFARQALPAPLPSASGTRQAAALTTKLIYLNKDGVTLTPGNNDSRANVSSIAQAATQLRPWAVSPTGWTQTVSCLNDIFARFNVKLVTADPGNVPHVEAVFTSDTYSQLDPSDPNGNRYGGVSPFTLDCSVIDNSIVFTFAGLLNNDPQVACEVMAQEIVHSYGADHELLASDPMTYLPYNGKRAFQDQLVSCGESTARPCGINGSTCRAQQNSVALLTERVGLRDNTPPEIGAVTPADGETVAPGYEITVNATDIVGVAQVEAFVDGVSVGIKTAAPYTFATDAQAVDGSHAIVIKVSDGANEVQKNLSVVVAQNTPPTDPNNPAGGTGVDPLNPTGPNTGDGVTPTPGTTGGCTSSGAQGGLFLGLAMAIAVRRRKVVAK